MDQAAFFVRSQPSDCALFREKPSNANQNIRTSRQDVITAIGIVYFLILKMGWHRGGPPIFGNVAEHLMPNEQVRGVFLRSRGLEAWSGYPSDTKTGEKSPLHSSSPAPSLNAFLESQWANESMTPRKASRGRLGRGKANRLPL